MNTKTNLNNVLRNVEANLFDCRHGSELTTAEPNKAIKIAKQAWEKDAKVADFLTTHAKREGSLSAKILCAALRDVGPRVASFDKTVIDVDKTAGKHTYRLYGFPTRTARLGLTSCALLREEAGRVASEMHARKADCHGDITGFLSRHATEAKCRYAKMLSACYPEASCRLASTQPSTVAEWLDWED